MFRTVLLTLCILKSRLLLMYWIHSTIAIVKKRGMRIFVSNSIHILSLCVTHCKITLFVVDKEIEPAFSVSLSVCVWIHICSEMNFNLLGRWFNHHGCVYTVYALYTVCITHTFKWFVFQIIQATLLFCKTDQLISDRIMCSKHCSNTVWTLFKI